MQILPPEPSSLSHVQFKTFAIESETFDCFMAKKLPLAKTFFKRSFLFSIIHTYWAESVTFAVHVVLCLNLGARCVLVSSVIH